MATSKKNSESAKKYYDSKYYSKINNGWEEFEQGEIAKRLLKSIEISSTTFKGVKVLDIGCGRGEVCAYLSNLGAECIGIDYSNDAIKIAKKTFGKNATFYQMDCTKMNFQQNKFDIIFMLDVVEHLEQKELEKTIANCYSILKPEGKLIIHTMPNAFLAKPFYFICKLTKTQRGINSKVHINEQTVFSLKRLLKKFNTKIQMAHEKNYFKTTMFYAQHRSRIKSIANLFLTRDFSKIPFVRIFLAAEIYVIAKKSKK